MSAVRPVPVIDALLATTAKATGLILIARKTPHTVKIGVDTLDPFKAAPAPSRNV